MPPTPLLRLPRLSLRLCPVLKASRAERRRTLPSPHRGQPFNPPSLLA
nr:MAG TPA: hypothetical protein [Caudoviricetes sp.]